MNQIQSRSLSIITGAAIAILIQCQIDKYQIANARQKRLNAQFDKKDQTLDRIHLTLVDQGKDMKKWMSKLSERLFYTPAVKILGTANKEENKPIYLKELLVKDGAIDWVYLPEKKLWHDAGINRTQDTPEMYCLDDLMAQTPLVYSLNAEDELIVCSTHQQVTDHSDETNDTDWILVKKAILPSQFELELMLTHSLYFYEKHPKGTLTFRVLSSSGITEYGITTNARKSLLDKSLIDIGREAVATHYHISSDVGITGLAKWVNTNTSPPKEYELKVYNWTNFVFDNVWLSFTPSNSIDTLTR